MSNEKRLIDANLVDERLAADLESGEGKFSISWFRSWISVQETVDAVEVVHGYNLDEDTPSLFECSICRWSCSDTYYGDTADYNYCPNCGAKMDGDGNG